MAIVGMFGLFFRFLGFGRSTFLDHDLKNTHTTPQRPQNRAAALEGAEIDSIDIGNDIELNHALKKHMALRVPKSMVTLIWCSAQVVSISPCSLGVGKIESS